MDSNLSQIIRNTSLQDRFQRVFFEPYHVDTQTFQGSFYWDSEFSKPFLLGNADLQITPEEIQIEHFYPIREHEDNLKKLGLGVISYHKMLCEVENAYPHDISQRDKLVHVITHMSDDFKNLFARLNISIQQPITLTEQRYNAHNWIKKRIESEKTQNKLQ